MIDMIIDGFFLFNAIIDGLDLRELESSNCKFTWANSGEILTFEKLDMNSSDHRMGIEVPPFHCSSIEPGNFRPYSPPTGFRKWHPWL